MYENIPGRPLVYPSVILSCIAVAVTAPIYVFYRKGPQIRERSKFAQSLDENRQKSQAKRTGSTMDASAGMKAGTDLEKRENG